MVVPCLDHFCLCSISSYLACKFLLIFNSHNNFPHNKSELTHYNFAAYSKFLNSHNQSLHLVKSILWAKHSSSKITIMAKNFFTIKQIFFAYNNFYILNNFKTYNPISSKYTLSWESFIFRW